MTESAMMSTDASRRRRRRRGGGDAWNPLFVPFCCCTSFTSSALRFVVIAVSTLLLSAAMLPTSYNARTAPATPRTVPGGGQTTSDSTVTIGRRSFAGKVLGTAAAASLGAATSVASVGRPAAGAAAAADPSRLLIERMAAGALQQMPSSASASGVDNTYYPDWLEGTWDATQTLVDVSAPLGARFLGGPNGDESIAAKSLAETRSQLGKPIPLKLRYVRTPWGVAEDRVNNYVERLNGYAGRVVVASADYADVRASNREAVLKNGGSPSDPLQTVFVRFKGPAAQKTFLTGHAGYLAADASDGEASWVGYEGQRLIFALTNESTAPPIWTDSELLWRYTLQGDGSVRGRLRIAGYLNAQSDKLFFDAKSRAVSIQDYDLVLRKVA